MASKTSETKDGSAARFAVLMQPISAKYGAEIGAQIVPANPFDQSKGYRIEGTFVSNYANPKTGMLDQIDSFVDIHTHPVARFNYGHPFSGDDFAREGYVTVPNGRELPRVFYQQGGGTTIREVPLR